MERTGTTGATAVCGGGRAIAGATHARSSQLQVPSEEEEAWEARIAWITSQQRQRPITANNDRPLQPPELAAGTATADATVVRTT